MEEDSEKEGFNAKVNKDEMIINIDEYTEMKEAIKWHENNQKRCEKDISYLKQKIEEKSEENKKLKNGIIKLFKELGNYDG